MDDLQRLLIERDCARLVARYCHFIDNGEAENVAGLFAEDAVWESDERRFAGRKRIAAAFAARAQNKGRISRHVCSNLLVEVHDGDHATGVVYLTLFREDGEPGRGTASNCEPAFVGEYRDLYCRTDEGWRIARRQVVAAFVRAEPASG